MYRPSDYAYHLPLERIAQHPLKNRDQARLLTLERKSGALAHGRIADLPARLQPGDVLVINDTRVIPGRLFGRKPTGGRVEVLIIGLPDAADAGGPGSYTTVCECLIRAAKRPRPGTALIFEDGLRAEVLADRDAAHRVAFHSAEPLDAVISRIGKVPLPPYILRETPAGVDSADAATYQTVYAARNGAIAAPTAGLHFTPDLLDRIRARGVHIARITLHVGYGTFVPVRVPDIREHRMHAEWFEISPESAGIINQARDAGGRVIAVGTTSVRTLEYAATPEGRVSARRGDCDLFIYPGYRFRVVEGIITNFHLPESTLLMLVSAFAGRENILSAYAIAIENGYRFYSYGDAMFIHPSAQP